MPIHFRFIVVCTITVHHTEKHDALIVMEALRGDVKSTLTLQIVGSVWLYVLTDRYEWAVLVYVSSLAGTDTRGIVYLHVRLQCLLYLELEK